MKINLRSGQYLLFPVEGLVACFCATAAWGILVGIVVSSAVMALWAISDRLSVLLDQGEHSAKGGVRK